MTTDTITRTCSVCGHTSDRGSWVAYEVPGVTYCYECAKTYPRIEPDGARVWFPNTNTGLPFICMTCGEDTVNQNQICTLCADPVNPAGILSTYTPNCDHCQYPYFGELPCPVCAGTSKDEPREHFYVPTRDALSDRHPAVDILAAYHRQCAECCRLCDQAPCTCDVCTTYRQTDRERETYFQELIAQVGNHAAYAYWQQARALLTEG